MALWYENDSRRASIMLFFRNSAILAGLIFLGQPVLANAASPDAAGPLLKPAAMADASALEQFKQAAERHDPEALYRL